jgi:hypothetical protein
MSLIRYITSCFSTLNSFYVLYTTHAYIDGFVQIRKILKNIFCKSRLVVEVCYKDYEGILGRLTLYSKWRRNLDALFLINVLKNRITFSSISDSVCVRI